MKKNLYETSEGRAKVLRRFSAFDGVGADLTSVSSYDEALEAAKLDYNVVKIPVKRLNGEESENFFWTAIESSLETDNPIELGVVGSKYSAVDNRTAFGVAEAIVDSGWANYEVGGPSFGAKDTFDYSRAFMVLRGEGFYVGDDPYDSFVVLNNSFDGSSGIKCMILCQRLVCLNGMTRFLGGAKSQLKINIQHSSSAFDRLREAEKIMMERTKEIDEIKREAEMFIGIKYTKKQFEETIIPRVLESMKLVEKDKERQRGQERIERVVRELIQAYNADDVQNYNNTAYKIILALSDFETHSAPMRDFGNSQIYLNRISKGMLLTTGVAQFIAEQKGLKIRK